LLKNFRHPHEKGLSSGRVERGGKEVSHSKKTMRGFEVDLEFTKENLGKLTL